VFAQSRLLVRIVTSALILLALSGCAPLAPSHEIPARPDFIHAGVQVGDTVDINLKNGEKRSFTVVAIGPDWIQGNEEQISFVDIEKLVKRSWTVPGNPCGTEKPAACDIPAVVRVLSDSADEYAERFHAACVTHDYCYAHGLATYGATRQECDDIFYEDMKRTCLGPAGLGVIDPENFSECQLVASQAHAAVQRFGEKHYLSTTSTVCEYRLMQ